MALKDNRLYQLLSGKEEVLTEADLLQRQNDKLKEDLDKAKDFGDLYNLLESNLDQMIGTLEHQGAWVPIGQGYSASPDLIPIERVKLIRVARQYWLKDPLIHQAVQLTTHYTFGNGMRYSCNNQEIQDVLDNFWLDEDNQLEITSHLAQEQKSAELQVDGEIFFILFEDADGNIKVRTLPPEEITNVITSADDHRRPLYYERQFVPQIYDWQSQQYKLDETAGGGLKTVYYQDWRNYAPGEWGIEPKDFKLQEGLVFHVPVNRIGWQRRGYTETYAALDWVKAHRQMLQDWVTIVKAYSSLAWKAKIKGDDPRSFDAIRDKIKSMVPAFAPHGQQFGQPAGTAGVAFENDAVAFQPMKTAGMATNPQDARQIRLMAGAGMGIAEHYFGDPGNANLATASAMDLPMLKKFEARQRLWEGNYLAFLNYQVMRKIELGQLDGLKIITITDANNRIVSKRLDTTVEKGNENGNKINVQCPPILQRNLAEVAQSIVPLQQANLIPLKEAARYALKAMDLPNAEEIVEEMEAEGKFDIPVNPYTGEVMPPGSDPSKVPDPMDQAKQMAQLHPSTAAGGPGASPNGGQVSGANIPRIRVPRSTPPDETNGGGSTA